jgi:hypothetical protein
MSEPTKRKRNDKRKGKPSQLRPVTDAPTANQHVSNPRQEAFLDAYLTIGEPTFGNAYASAIAVGYSDAYAREILSKKNAQEWIIENPRIRALEPKHIELMVEDIAVNSGEKTTDRLKALELSARLKGMLIERKHVQSEVITISLGTLDNAYAEPQAPMHVEEGVPLPPLA